MSAPRSGFACRVAAIGAVLACVVLTALPPGTQPARGETAGDGGSAVTVRVSQGEFAGLEVTVSKTKDLVNQAITVTWKGATPTPRTRSLGTDYLQLMQCWGRPDPRGDPLGLKLRETCQFGAELEVPNPVQFGTASQGANGRGRYRLGTIPGYPADDPDERLAAGAQIVPFRPVTGKDVTPDGSAADPFPIIKEPKPPFLERPAFPVEVLAKHFGPATTNEYPFALTAADGTGRVAFEVQNAGLVPDLGCGGADTGGGPRRCSLVIVPRGHRHPYTGEDVTGTGAVHGSPFVPALWKNRIVVPLEFAPAGGYCSLTQAERRTAGTELVAEAVTAWQPALCEGGGPIFGYSAIGDFEAARQILSPLPGAPGLIFSTDPVPASGGPALVHAPVALSGVVVALNVDANIVDPTLAEGPIPPEVERLRGLALRDLKLTPRLVAKLLTQSYQRDAKSPVGAKNPDSVRLDPEFLTLNPVFKSWDRSRAATLDGLMVAVGSSAAARELWRWLLGDPETGAWLRGAPDESGMKINPHYAGLFKGAAPDLYPKADPSCTSQPYQGTEYRHCTLDLRPYLGTMGEAAVQTLRADPKGRQPTLDVFGEVPRWVPIPRRPPGFRFAMSVTESGSAARYGLFTAQLCKPKRGGDGALVPPDDCRGPTPGAISAAAATAVPSRVSGVKVIDPVRAWTTPGAYPLAMVTYAIGDTTEPVAARRDYATLIRYAAGAGQVRGSARGQLPEGYVPLPAAMRAQARAAADALRDARAPAPPPPAAPVQAPPPPPSRPNAVPSAGSAPSPGGTAPSPLPPAARAARATRGSPVGPSRYLLIGALVVGLVGGVAGPVLQRLAMRGNRR